MRVGGRWVTASQVPQLTTQNNTTIQRNLTKHNTTQHKRVEGRWVSAGCNQFCACFHFSNQLGTAFACKQTLTEVGIFCLKMARSKILMVGCRKRKNTITDVRSIVGLNISMPNVFSVENESGFTFNQAMLPSTQNSGEFILISTPAPFIKSHSITNGFCLQLNMVAWRLFGQHLNSDHKILNGFEASSLSISFTLT